MEIDYDQRWKRNHKATQRRLVLKQAAAEYLGGKCQICGYSKCLSALVFHHVDPREKDFHVMRSLCWEKVKSEAMKCYLLCANCHAEVHAGDHPQYLLAEDDYSDC